MIFGGALLKRVQNTNAVCNKNRHKEQSEKRKSPSYINTDKTQRCYFFEAAFYLDQRPIASLLLQLLYFALYRFNIAVDIFKGFSFYFH